MFARAGSNVICMTGERHGLRFRQQRFHATRYCRVPQQVGRRRRRVSPITLASAMSSEMTHSEDHSDTCSQASGHRDAQALADAHEGKPSPEDIAGLTAKVLSTVVKINGALDAMDAVAERICDNCEAVLKLISPNRKRSLSRTQTERSSGTARRQRITPCS